jgi:hypothetical protein
VEDGNASLGEGTGSAPAPAPADTAHAPKIGKIDRVPLRKVWPHEAYDLTTWLEENIDIRTTCST